MARTGPWPPLAQREGGHDAEAAHTHSLSPSLSLSRPDPRPCSRFTLVICLTALVSAFAPIERAATPDLSEPPGSDSEPQLVLVRAGPELERGPHHQVLQTITEYSDLTGRLVAQTNAITVLATGLSYFQDGQWRETVEEIELFDQGAVARQGSHRVLWSPNATSDEGVDVLTADGQRFRSQVLGLSYYDAASGASVLIAELKASQAELSAPNRLVYPDAFDGVQADLAYEYHRASVAQEVVLRGPLPEPAQFGMNPATTRLEVLTEFYESPVPVIERLVVRAETDPGQRALMHEPDLTDDQLQFAEYAMGAGRAFGVGSDASVDSESVPVVKRWEAIDGRTILLEQVEWPALAALLAQLPGQANATPGERSVERVPSIERQLPLRPRVAQANPNESNLVPFDLVAAQCPGHPCPGAGVVVDWVLVQSQTNFAFKGDTTYLVMDSVNLSGSTTIEGGTVVKYTNAVASPKLSITGTILCQTGPYRPAVFTAKDDNTVGEIIPTSTGNPSGYYGNPAIEVRSVGQVMGGIRVRYAQTGVFYQDLSAGTGSGLLHAQLVGCGAAVRFNGRGTVFQNFTLRNVLVHDCSTAVYGYSFAGQVEHLTAHDCTWLAYDYYGQKYGTTSSLSVTNSVLAQIGSLYSGRPVTVSGGYNGLWASPVVGSPCWTNNSNPFLTVGAGAHYLEAVSEFHDKGTSSMSQGLRDALMTRTTHAPEELLSSFTADTTLPVSSMVTRDTDAPDLGWHYEPLDYLWSNLNLTNATLTLTGGVAVGMGGSRGLRLQNGARVVSEGDPLALNWLVPYDVVQEQPLVGGGGPLASLFEVNGMPAVLPEVRLRFTGVSFLAGHYNKRLLLRNWSQYSLDTLELRDCLVHGGALDLSLYPVGDARVMTVGLTNNLFARVGFSLDQDTDVPRLVVHARNNLFLQGWVRLADYMGTGTWSVRDNLFDAVSLSGEAVPNSHNGYYGTPLLPGSTNHRVLTAVDYLPGPLGLNYYPNTGGNLSELINHGSRPASEAGLYLKTLLASQAPEGTSQVDIGYHYVPIVTPELVTTNLAGAVDVDYHSATPGTNECLIVSVNYDDGDPFNLARVDSDGSVTSWSTIAHEYYENPLTTARTDGYGFTNGQTFFATGTLPASGPVRIWRVSPNGGAATQWATVGDTFWPGGLHIDATGVFGHDLILVTGWLADCLSGSVWRINGQTGLPTPIATLGTCLEGVSVCPTNQAQYGPWAGKVLTGAGDQWLVYHIAPDGTTDTTDLGLSPHDFHVIPPNQDLYVVQFVPKDEGPSRLLKVPRAFFANLQGDILIVQSGEFDGPLTLLPSNGELFVVHWAGTAFDVTRITDGKPPEVDPRQFEHAVFAPLSIPSIP